MRERTPIDAPEAARASEGVGGWRGTVGPGARHRRAYAAPLALKTNDAWEGEAPLRRCVSLCRDATMWSSANLGGPRRGHSRKQARVRTTGDSLYPPAQVSR